MYKLTYYFVGIVLFLGFVQRPANAQSIVNEAYYDSITYQYYQQKNWKTLIDTGNWMRKQGLDYYYLRMRMGIACLELQKTAKAETHFRQALNFKTADAPAILLLSKSLNYQMKNVEAGSLFQKMTKEYQQQSGMKSGFRPVSAHLDIGTVNRGSENGLDFVELAGSEGIFGQEHFYHNNQFYDAGLYFQTNPQWLMYVGAQYISIVATDRFAYLENNLLLDSVVTSSAGDAYYYKITNDERLVDFDHQLTQKALYFQLQWAGSDRWSLVSSLQLFQAKRDFTIPDQKLETITDTAFYDSSTGSLELFETELSKTTFSTVAWETNDYSMSLHGKYHVGIFTATGGLTKASVNDSSAFQINAGYQINPLGNLKLVHQGEFLYLNMDSRSSSAYRFLLGWRPGKRSSLELDYLFGHLNNLSEQYSYIVYNNPETVSSRFEASASYMVTKHLQLQLRYRLHEYQRRYDYLFEGSELKTNYYTTKSNTLIGGIKWIF